MSQEIFNCAWGEERYIYQMCNGRLVDAKLHFWISEAELHDLISRFAISRFTISFQAIQNPQTDEATYNV